MLGKNAINDTAFLTDGVDVYWGLGGGLNV